MFRVCKVAFLWFLGGSKNGVEIMLASNTILFRISWVWATKAAFRHVFQSLFQSMFQVFCGLLWPRVLTPTKPAFCCCEIDSRTLSLSLSLSGSTGFQRCFSATPSTNDYYYYTGRSTPGQRNGSDGQSQRRRCAFKERPSCQARRRGHECRSGDTPPRHATLGKLSAAGGHAPRRKRGRRARPACTLWGCPPSGSAQRRLGQ